MLPELTKKVNIREIYVDGTPDGQYALRILRAFRAKCDAKWVLVGVDKEGARDTDLVFKTMNEHQDMRAKELDKAISILERELIK
jgi:hypothetical protein